MILSTRGRKRSLWAIRCIFFLATVCLRDNDSNFLPSAEAGAYPRRSSSAARRHRYGLASDEEETRNTAKQYRNLNQHHGHHKSSYYKFLNDEAQSKHTTLMDVWLCLACALGWSCWFVSTTQPNDRLLFETRDSQKVMGHVLQLTLGEDNLGTGIPVYHAVIDYVVEGDVDGEPLQIRKVFSTNKLLEEGFANVEVLVLTDDPTTAILMEDFLEQKKDQEKLARDSPSMAYLVMIYLVAAILIGTSIVGSVLVILRMKSPLYGWISLGIGVALMYPMAHWLTNSLSYLCSMAGPLHERPGSIIHGQRYTCSGKRCGAMLDPSEIFGDDEKPSNGNTSKTVELADLNVPDLNNNADDRKIKEVPPTPQHLFPNAGCGFGAFQVHLPLGRPRTNSSMSSMSTSQNSHHQRKLAPADKSVLEKYELHVAQLTKEETKR